MKTEYTLSSFVQLDVLRTIQDSFSIATGLAAVFADEYGNELGEGANYSEFCSKLHSHEKGRNACKFSNYLAGQKAKKLKKPFIYWCHAGLIDIAVPIIVDTQFLGTMMAGQVKCLDPESPCTERLPSYENWQEAPDYKELHEKIEYIPRKKIEAAAHTLFIVVNYIVQKKISEIAQETVNKQKEQLLNAVKARAELENSLKEARLIALQNQINPHFMFNVLNTISRLIGLKQCEKAQEVMGAFTQMLRYSLHDIQKILPLHTELNYIQKYLYIQNLRFGDRISYQISIEPELLEMGFPFFTLQPLVENAIVHGLEPKEEGGLICLTSSTTITGYELIVKDNGIGMPPDKVENILMNLKSTGNNFKGYSHVGISNVYKRLKLYLGEDNFDFSISSQINHGTTVKLSFKMRK